jgi:hypothetical protein
LEKFRFSRKIDPAPSIKNELQNILSPLGKISTLMNFTQGIMKEINFKKKGREYAVKNYSK